MGVAENGRIDVIWLDTRDNPDTYLSSLYYSYSFDQGETWSEDIRLTDAFEPKLGWPRQNKIGDYFDMKSNNSGFHLAWANTFNNEQDVYYLNVAIDEVLLNTSVKYDSARFIQIFPNPINESFTIINNSKNSIKQIKIFDLNGTLVKSLNINSNNINIEKLKSGVYFIRFESNNNNYQTLKIFKH